jgi:hypothetical protein
MEVSGQLHAPAALSAEKEPPVPIGQEAGGGPRAGLDTAVTKREKIPLLQPEIKPLSSSP